jgi:hypothetical protein
VCASDENWASGARLCVSRSCARRSWRKIKSSELRVGARANCIIKQAANESESHSSARRRFIITVIPIGERAQRHACLLCCAALCARGDESREKWPKIGEFVIGWRAPCFMLYANRADLLREKRAIGPDSRRGMKAGFLNS